MLENENKLLDYWDPLSDFQKMSTKLKYNANMVAMKYTKRHG